MMQDNDNDEQVKMGPMERNALEQAKQVLMPNNPNATNLAAVPTVVSMRNVVLHPPSSGDEEQQPLSSLVLANHGHHALFAALEQLEKLEPDSELELEQATITSITSIITSSTAANTCIYINDNKNKSKSQYSSSQQALEALETLGAQIPRRVCQHPFRKNDIVWVCRTCQSDETCVLCHECFSQSNHDGHDVAFYHAQAGGCCDCGDPDAWDAAGFCPRHGPQRLANGDEAGLDPSIISQVRGVVRACGDWLVEGVAQQAVTAHERTIQKKTLPKSESMPVKSSKQSTSRTLGMQHSMGNAVGGSSSSEDEFDDSDDNEDEDNSMQVSHGLIFSPLAASTSKSRHGNNILEDPQNTAATAPSSSTTSPAQTLGKLGLDGHGLYLVVHADDIHSTAQLVDAFRELLGPSSYYTDSLLGRFVRSLRHHGQLVVWGTMELLAECSSNQVQLWLDGDGVMAAKIGASMMHRASTLVKHGCICSIYTRSELQLEQTSVAVLQFLTALARSCDPMCSTVAESLQAQRHLVPMLNADFTLGARITKSWHSLLLTLLAVPIFKSRLAAAYCDTYRHVTAEYARGMGVLERSGYTLSVQFLNRVTYVVGLVQGRDLLGKLGKSLLETLTVALKKSKGSGNVLPRLNPNHFVLTHRRYSPCISDLKCVLNVKGMARLFASKDGTFLQDWIEALSLAQCMDGQEWRSLSQGHVEIEPRGWVGAFNASISLGSLFERLLSWDDEDPSPIAPQDSPVARNLQSCVNLTSYILTHGLAQWQMWEMQTHRSTTNTSMLEPHRRCPNSLPVSTIAVGKGSTLCIKALPMAQVTPFSFHLPLHRFVAACLREVCRRPNPQYVHELFQLLKHQVVHSKQEQEQYDDALLFWGLLEFPVLVLARSAQIRAGLWRRNGPGMQDQVLNYAEPPFCRALRDADLLLVQFAMLGKTATTTTMMGRRSKDDDHTSNVVGNSGCSFLVHLLLHRFGLFDFVGFSKAPNTNIEGYLQQVKDGLYPAELSVEHPTTTTSSSTNPGKQQHLVLPWTYTPAKDVTSSLNLLEEFLHLLIVLITELPCAPPQDKAEHTLQAKERLRREVVHRLASGAQTHSQLAEVHHVLSHLDNVCLSEEGKQVNPDDATGAALEAALAEVAERKSSRGRLAPDQWELKSSGWNDYDPSFFHISTRFHQVAAENRPPPKSQGPFGVEALPYAPSCAFKVHPAFARLRRDLTADASVLAILYRTLHVHCRDSKQARTDMTDLRGKSAYDVKAMSEMALARSVHLLTLGAFAWSDESFQSMDWRLDGGASVGSIFYNWQDSAAAAVPSAADWIAAMLLGNPKDIMDDEWYNGQENALLLLRRLAVDGGSSGGFVAQDRAVRAGAAWLCEFAIQHNPDAANLIGQDKSTQSNDNDGADTKETELQRRKREAKARAMERMKAAAKTFADKMQIDVGEEESDADNAKSSDDATTPDTPRLLIHQTSSVSQQSSAYGSEGSGPSSGGPQSPARSEFSWASGVGEAKHHTEEAGIPPRLLKQRPQCIICSEGAAPTETENSSSREEHDDSHRKKSRRKADGANALGFVGYAQASTVLKGGGGPPPQRDSTSALSTVRRFVGTHVTLCGHAIHSECCESYLASQREERSIGRRDEFRCPLCQRLSNCLVPFIDVGADWVDQTTCLPVPTNQSNLKSCDDDAMSIEDTATNDEQEQFHQPLHQFLSTTPWWVSRHDSTVVWDGRCAFVASQDASLANLPDEVVEPPLVASPVTAPRPKIARKRSMRSLRKKDLYAAWTAVMRTPRFIRRKHKSRNLERNSEDAASAMDDGRERTNTPQWLRIPDESSSGESVVWRRLMDLIAEVAFRADGKRLGEDNLHSNFGEFRHYQVERFAYNVNNRAAAVKENIDWPACISSTPLPDSQRQELSRERVLSKLLISIQSLTYSVSSEASEVRRLLRELSISSDEELDESGIRVQEIYSKFGVQGTCCGGQLVLTNLPSASTDDGSQPFDGRLGKLRYFALAVMAAAGAVSADLVQLVLDFPLQKGSLGLKDDSMDLDESLRAPVVYPILLGQVLTHVVAAMCAACGRARARSDALEFAWPMPLSRRGSFYGKIPEEVGDVDKVDAVINDCEGFIKLGLLARMLQVLLGHLDFSPGGENWEDAKEIAPRLLSLLLRAINDEAIGGKFSTGSKLSKKWLLDCYSLLEVVLSGDSSAEQVSPTKFSSQQNEWTDKFLEACSMAAEVAMSFLADCGAILQILIPGSVEKYASSNSSSETIDAEADIFGRLQQLFERFGVDALDEVLKSNLVRDVLQNWYRSAIVHGANTQDDSTPDVLGSTLQKRLFQNDGFRFLDWPMESAQEQMGKCGLKSMLQQVPAEPHEDNITSMEIETFPSRIRAPQNQTKTIKAGLFPAYSSKKLVPLIGGYLDGEGVPATCTSSPRISMLPTSYTDLYAELGSLCPDSDQIGLCLVCGEVLNAGGKSECTKHSVKCGAGAGIFFLLQECVGLIMHGGKAAYVHSPYVDSHGETPQYRGRPLNLDMDRYNILREMWSGHSIRQKVIAERGSSRQVIIPDFY